MSFVINSNLSFMLFLVAYPLIVVKTIHDNVWNNFLKTNISDNSSFLFNMFRLAKAIAKVWQI